MFYNLFWHICPPVPPTSVLHSISLPTLWPLHVIVINNPQMQLIRPYIQWMGMRSSPGTWAIYLSVAISLKESNFPSQLSTDMSSFTKEYEGQRPVVNRHLFYNFDVWFCATLMQVITAAVSWHTTPVLFLEVIIWQLSSSSSSHCIAFLPPSMMFPQLCMGGGSIDDSSMDEHLQLLVSI